MVKTVTRVTDWETLVGEGNHERDVLCWVYLKRQTQGGPLKRNPRKILSTKVGGTITHR